MNMKTIKLLVVEDNPGDARLISEMLESEDETKFAIFNAGRITDARNILIDEKFDAILLDLALPDSFGLDSFFSVMDLGIKTPIVVLTGNDDEELAVKAVREGAQDYIVKTQLEGRLLARSIKYAIERHKTIIELQNMSFIDELTGLYNRRGFIILSDEHFKLAKREIKYPAVFFVDMDGMKYINDAFGHEEGDRALIDTANVLKRTFRESDIIARLGGDEFAILAIMSTPDSRWVEERIQKAIADINSSGRNRYTLSLSVGWSVAGEETKSVNELIQEADERMYEQKKTKKNARRD